MSAQWVTWNGGSGKYRDNQGRARTRIHITESLDNHLRVSVILYLKRGKPLVKVPAGQRTATRWPSSFDNVFSSC